MLFFCLSGWYFSLQSQIVHPLLISSHLYLWHHRRRKDAFQWRREAAAFRVRHHRAKSLPIENNWKRMHPMIKTLSVWAAPKAAVFFAVSQYNAFIHMISLSFTPRKTKVKRNTQIRKWTKMCADEKQTNWESTYTHRVYTASQKPLMKRLKIQLKERTK